MVGIEAERREEERRGEGDGEDGGDRRENISGRSLEGGKGRGEELTCLRRSRVFLVILSMAVFRASLLSFRPA